MELAIPKPVIEIPIENNKTERVEEPSDLTIVQKKHTPSSAGVQSVSTIHQREEQQAHQNYMQQAITVKNRVDKRK